MWGKRLGIAGDHLTGNQMATALTLALGKEGGRIRRCHLRCTAVWFSGLAEDLGNMFLD